VIRQHFGLLGAFAAGCNQTWGILKNTLLGVGQMIAGHASPDLPLKHIPTPF